MIDKKRYKNKTSLKLNVVDTIHYCSFKIEQIWSENDRRDKLVTILSSFICLLLFFLTDSIFTHNSDMNQLSLYMQILRTLKKMNSNIKEFIFENCKHRIVIYDEKFLNKNTIENKLRSFLSSEVIFFNDWIITHRWIEKKSFCDLFAELLSLKLYNSIKNWIKNENCSCNYYKHIVSRMHETVKIFEKSFIFHFAIRCDFRIMFLIEHMRTLDNEFMLLILN